MSDPIDTRFTLAQTIAAEGAELALRFFNARDTLIVEDKVNPQDMVSQADREVDVLLRAHIPSSGRVVVTNAERPVVWVTARQRGYCNQCEDVSTFAL